MSRSPSATQVASAVNDVTPASISVGEGVMPLASYWVPITCDRKNCRMNDPPTAVPKTPAALQQFASYQPVPDQYDEMFSAAGVVRPHWEEFLRHLNELGSDELQKRWRQAQRAIHENGVTYSASTDPDASSRPWILDAVPLLLTAKEWSTMSEALAQRARLLELVLDDLYGPQKLLREGLLPPDLVFGNAAFHRAFHDLPAPGGRRMHFYAADLARAADGKWWVVGDRTRAASGAGYALENRVITSRMLTTAFRGCRVERLAPFFIKLQETLKELAPQFKDNPRIVLLTAGPSGSNYFEDAYLARYLGYTMVEGADLAVRGGRVMLKTLGGLLPVEVILRRTADDDLDPVELRSCVAGVSGLLDIIRDGRVVCVNSPGSALAESPALMAFLPAICRKLLGEELQLPSVATWWCGQQGGLKYVLENLDQLVIRQATGVYRNPGVHAERLSKAAREELIASLRAKPGDYAAQEQVNMSTAPAWTDAGPQPWHLILRSFLVARGDEWTALPGGLVRVSADPLTLIESMQSGERSQDAWVLADEPIREISLLRSPEDQSATLLRSGSDLPSRVADNLFWLGRAVERTEGAARLLRAVCLRLTSESESAEIPELAPLIRSLAEQGQIEPDFVVGGFQESLPTVEVVLPSVVLDASEPGSLLSAVHEIIRLASTVRDRVSIDARRVIHRIEEYAVQATDIRSTLDTAELLSLLNGLVLDLATFSGLVGDCMTRTLGWRFLQIGKRIERASNMVTLLRSTLFRTSKHERSMLEAVLEIADSSMTYRNRYLSNIVLIAVLDLLIADETNPRSIAFQLATLQHHIERLPRDSTKAALWPEERIALSLVNQVKLLDMSTLSETSGDGEYQRLTEVLSQLDEQLPSLARAISNRYLIHAGIPRQFSQ